MGQRQVVGIDQPAAGNVDQPAIKYILAEQHLARASGELAQVQRLADKTYLARLKLGHEVCRHEQIASSDADLEPGNPRIAAVREADDDVPDAPERVPGGTDDGALHQFGQKQQSSVVLRHWHDLLTAGTADCAALVPALPSVVRASAIEKVPSGVAVSVSTRSEEPQLERPPDYADYRPPRTTAEGGATMLLSGVFLAGALVALGLAVYTKLADVRTFGQINNLLMFAVALLLVAVYLLVWEITLRLIARADD